MVWKTHEDGLVRFSVTPGKGRQLLGVHAGVATCGVVRLAWSLIILLASSRKDAMKTSEVITFNVSSLVNSQATWKLDRSAEKNSTDEALGSTLSNTSAGNNATVGNAPMADRSKDASFGRSSKRKKKTPKREDAESTQIFPVEAPVEKRFSEYAVCTLTAGDDSCPQNWTFTTGWCYVKLDPEQSKTKAAEQYCKKFGARIVQVTERSKNNAALHVQFFISWGLLKIVISFILLLATWKSLNRHNEPTVQCICVTDGCCSLAIAIELFAASTMLVTGIPTEKSPLEGLDWAQVLPFLLYTLVVATVELGMCCLNTVTAQELRVEMQTLRTQGNYCIKHRQQFDLELEARTKAELEARTRGPLVPKKGYQRPEDRGTTSSVREYMRAHVKGKPLKLVLENHERDELVQQAKEPQSPTTFGAGVRGCSSDEEAEFLEQKPSGVSAAASRI